MGADWEYQEAVVAHTLGLYGRLTVVLPLMGADWEYQEAVIAHTLGLYGRLTVVLPLSQAPRRERAGEGAGG